mmetsp:Transcript_69533/g.190847  ORF Transcript_69533/g.190847 Transcript_69533/m.190847 type:complete len:187 (+) Transcript_69533:77-637(+)
MLAVTTAADEDSDVSLQSPPHTPEAFVVDQDETPPTCHSAAASEEHEDEEMVAALKIWEPQAIPSVAMLRPPTSLLAQGADLPRLRPKDILKWVGHQSHCYTVGRSCGGSDERSDRAWADFAACAPEGFDAFAKSFGANECSSLSEEQQVGAGAFVRLLLSPEGVLLLRHVAQELHGLERPECWAW